MSARGERNGQGQPVSLLGLAPEAADAAARHALARSRRERRPNPLLSADAPIDPDGRLDPDRDRQRHVLLDRLSSLVSRARNEDRDPEASPERDDLGDDPAALEAVNDGRRASLEEPAKPGMVRVVGLTLAGALVGASLAYAMPARYVATAELLVDPASTARAAQLSPETAFALVDNQLRVLRSGTMLGAVADRLNLASDTEFLGSGLFGGVTALVAGEPARVDGRQRAIEALAEAVEIERVEGSSAVTVSARTADAAKSALVVNTLAELYVAGSGSEAAGGTAADRLETLRAEVEEAERSVETYKARNELVDAQGRLISDEQVLDLGEQLGRAKARTVELNARAASTREANVDSIVTGSLPEQFASPTVTELRDRHAGLRQQMDRLTTRLGPRHPELLAAEAELRGVRQELASELRRIAGAVQTELKRAVRQEQDLAGELARMKVRQGQIGEELIELRELERAADVKRAAYEDALRAAQVASSGVAGDARILSRAQPPGSATRPLGAFSLAGALGGFLLGIGLSRRRDQAEEDGPVEERAPLAADGNPASSGTGASRQGSTKAGREDRGARKEDETMYPYPYQAGYQPMPVTPQPVQPHAVAAPAYGHPASPQPAPMPAAGFAPPPVWPQPHPMQAHYAPVDPWAHLRGYPQPYPPAYAPPAYAAQPPVFIYQAVPVQQSAEQVSQGRQERAPEPPVQRPAHRDEPHRQQSWDHHDQDRYVDEHTNSAIEEIRQSLRDFRDAIEDLADERFRERDRYDRYGT